MIFKKEVLQKLTWGGYDYNYKVISDVIDGTSRWSVQHDMVFKFKDKFYKTYYQVGATEYQDEGPYEYDPDDIECKEVFPKEITIVVYE